MSITKGRKAPSFFIDDCCMGVDYALFRNKKNVWRLVLFCIAVVTAIAAFTTGILQLGHRESGYQEVEPTAEGNAVLYESGVHLLYYAEGSSSEIRLKINEVQKIYTDILLRYYKMLDARKTYPEVINLASLNEQPGAALTVDEPLLRVLTDASEKAARGQGYQLFSGALHQEWRDLLYLEDASEFDPLNNTETAERIDSIAQMVNEQDAASLSFAGNQVTLNVSEAYLNFARERELDAPVLDLNLLHDAYLLELVAEGLTLRGYTEGYLYSDSGCSIYLSGEGTLAYELYGYNEAGVQAIGTVTLPSPSSFCQFTAFSPANARYGYYAVEGEDGRRLRHPFFNGFTGGFEDVLLTASLAASEGRLVDLAYHAVVLNTLENAAAVKEYMTALPETVFAACTLQNDAAYQLYTASAWTDKIRFYEGGVYRLALLK